MMNRLLVSILAVALVLPHVVGASEELQLDSAPIDLHDPASLQSGARTFVNYCLNCHSASMVRYSRLRDIGLTESQIKDNLLFTGEKVGEMMTIGMSRKDAAEWFGAAPPDLSVTARARGADWLYTYLRTFYRDPGSATGWNNTTFDRVGMPNVLWQLQGELVLREQVLKSAAGKEMRDESGNLMKAFKLETGTPGKLTRAEYDVVVRDLVNFMVWMAEPNQVWRRQVGVFVTIFLLVLVVLTYFLYREFWKDLH